MPGTPGSGLSRSSRAGPPSGRRHPTAGVAVHRPAPADTASAARGPAATDAAVTVSRPPPWRAPTRGSSALVGDRRRRARGSSARDRATCGERARGEGQPSPRPARARTRACSSSLVRGSCCWCSREPGSSPGSSGRGQATTEPATDAACGRVRRTGHARARRRTDGANGASDRAGRSGAPASAHAEDVRPRPPRRQRHRVRRRPAAAPVAPLPSPVPPTVEKSEPVAQPEAPKPALPPAMFGNAKWMQIDGSRVRENGGFLQITDSEVRLLDERGRGVLARATFGSISEVHYSSGKRPSWRKDLGPVPTESAFDSTDAHLPLRRVPGAVAVPARARGQGRRVASPRRTAEAGGAPPQLDVRLRLALRLRTAVAGASPLPRDARDLGDGRFVGRGRGWSDEAGSLSDATAGRLRRRRRARAPPCLRATSGPSSRG